MTAMTIATSQADEIQQEMRQVRVELRDNAQEIVNNAREIADWQFAIYKYSRDIYDPDETWFPGYEKFDGTIESALCAGLAAYPPG